MTLWKVDRYYFNHNNTPTYAVMPYHLKGHLKCCWKWYGLKGLKWCYLSKKRAEKKAKKLNNLVGSNT